VGDVGPGVRIVKRLIDVAGAIAGLTVTLPFYVPIAVAIRLDSAGPVFLVQRRSGCLAEDGDGGGRGEPHRWSHFDMYKFRTMTPDAESSTGAVLSSKGDSRVTRVGRILRATRLDELPQFWNVLLGDMSLVGPRPERPELLANLAMAIPYFEERTRGVKPGLTGLAQISLGYSGGAEANREVAALRDSLTNPFGIDEAEGALADGMRLKLMFDLAYAASLEDLRSYLPMELRILLKTPLVMAMSRGY
jgi:lipopolysaccharide/colanic/teichoic acid biosynthesis glycosyltransferase